MKIANIRITTQLSGAEIYNKYFYQGLSLRDKEKLIFISNHDGYLDCLRSLGASTMRVYLPIGEIGTKRELVWALLVLPLYLASFGAVLLRLYFSHGIESVVFQSTTEKIFLTLPLRLLGLRVTWIEHGPMFASQRSHVILGLFRYMSQFTHHLIGVSSHTCRDLVNGGIDFSRVKEKYIGVDTDYFLRPNKVSREIIRNSLHIPLHSVVVGYVGSISQAKGIVEFMNVARYVGKTDSSYYFLIVGDGDMTDWARKGTSQGDQEKRYVFIGKATDVKRYYSVIDILLFPTFCLEGISLVLLEAAAMECCIIAANTGGGNGEVIIPFKTGLLYNHDVDQSGKEIVNILSSLSPKKMKGYGSRAREHIKAHFDMKKQSRALLALFS